MDLVNMLKAQRKTLLAESRQLARKARAIQGAIRAIGKALGNSGGGRRRLSAAARARISRAQKKRWAKVRAAK